jgi:signal transduction histidine kinase
MKKPVIIFALITSCISFSLDAQPLRRLNSSSYNVDEGLLQSHIIDMNFDASGFMWLSFETGLQRCDGHNFNAIPVQGGLPENQYVLFLKSKNGLLWLFHSKGISVYNSFTNRFAFVFNFRSRGELPDICPISEDDGVVYFYTANGVITGINEKTFHIESSKTFPFSTHSADVAAIFKTSGEPINHEETICFDQLTLIKWNFKKGMAIAINHLPYSMNMIGSQFCPVNENECLYFIKGKLNLYNPQLRTYKPFPKNAVNKAGLDMASFERINQSQILMSVDNDLFLFDIESMRPLARFVNFQNQPFAHFPIQLMRIDNFGNIYLVTRNEGFVKLLASTYAISYYGSSQRELNFITSIEVDKKDNRILAGSLNGGLLVFDTLQRLQKHITKIGSMQTPGSLTISGIVHIKGNNYLLFPRLNRFCVLWNAVTGKMKKVPVKFRAGSKPDKSLPVLTFAYYNSKIKLDSTKELVGIDENLYEVTTDASPSVVIFHRSYRTKGLCKYQNYILTGEADNLCFLSTKNYSTIKEVHLPDCGEIHSVAAHNNFIYVGCIRGLLKLNSEGKIISEFTKATGMPDDYIYAVAIDSNENIWCSTNKGIIRISGHNDYLNLKKEDGLQENEFNTGMIAQENDGELFFGGVNGINSFYPGQIINMADSPKAVLTDIRVDDHGAFKDSATWIIKKISEPYNNNNLYFEFTSMGKRNPEQYLYEYKMSGVDKRWIQSGEVRNARYVLQPGKYAFQLYAGEEYDENPKNFTSIEIVITSPFWQTWWFLLATGVVLVAFVSLIVWQYNRRKFANKLRALQLKNEIQLERDRISRELHDNIGAQLSFISSNIDWVIDRNKDLDKEEELRQMKAINTTTKNVMTNLRETIWALHKDKITLQEFSDKLKVYIQNVMQLQSGLEFKSEEMIPNNFVLTPAEVLNIFRICQECVNNVIRHAHATYLKLTIQSDENTFCIRIEDNGAGFDVNEIPEGHYGLDNIRFRAGELNAGIVISSRKGEGTVVEYINNSNALLTKKSI